MRRSAALVVLVVLGGFGLQTGSAGAAEPLAWTSSAAILARAQAWVAAAVPYSQAATAPDLAGRAYRTDCSGFVSMAWGLPRSLTTLTLPRVSVALGPVGAYVALRPGDMLDSTTARHAVLFVGWADPSRTTAVVMEEPHPGAVARVDSSYYTTALLTAEGFVAYRYDRVHAPVAMDWNGDGYPDLIARATGTGTLVLFPGKPGGGYATHRPLAASPSFALAAQLVELNDVDGNGHPSLVARRADGSIWAYPSDGRGGVGLPWRVSVPGAVFASIAPAGARDPRGLVARATDGSMWFYPGDTQGGFRQPHRTAPPGAAPVAAPVAAPAASPVAAPASSRLPVADDGSDLNRLLKVDRQASFRVRAAAPRYDLVI
jgi:hypothetical protein